MRSKGEHDGGNAELRRQAEAELLECPAPGRGSSDALSDEETQKVLHELRVQRIELEIQNEELRCTQVKLAAAHERYFDLYDLAPVGYFSVGDKGLILQANLLATTLLGGTRGTLLGQPMSRYILKDDQHLYYLQRKQILATGDPQVLELRMVRDDGTRFGGQLRVTVASDADGASELRVVLSDVTERKEAEAALREKEQRYRTLFCKATDGILLVDSQGNVVDANDALAQMHGYTVDELLQMNLSMLDTPETLLRAPERLARILAGESIRFEVEHYHKDGHVMPLDVAAATIDMDGERYVLGFHRDISARRRTEQESKRSQQKIRELSKAANEALEAERRRTARELHDELGQSLTALKMDLESMRAGLPSHPELERRAKAMHVMLDGTIAATRRIAADLRPLMLDDLGLAAALDWLTQNFAKQTGIATDLVIDESVAQVPEPIASALYRITQESLTNVAKYAQATTTEVRLERDGEWVQLSVRDNGCGIGAADHDKRGAFGLLGMRERVMLLSGEIAIGSEPGGGSRVCARIPLDAAEAE
jgi:PAS domain S-box-containing protein